MAVELSTVIYDVPTLALAGKLQKLSFYAEEETRDKEKWEIYQLAENGQINNVRRENENPEPQTKAKVMPESTQTPTSPPPTCYEPYEIKHVTSGDYKRVLHHLQRFFFKDEPLNVSIKLLDGDGTCAELEDFAKKCMDHGVSYMAVSQSDEVVGVAVNAVDRRADAIDDEDCGNPKFQKILNLLTAVEREVGIFQRYKDIDSVMNCKILSVDSTWRGRGIAKQLLDKTRDVARQEGQQLMRVDCTSHFSAKAIARLGFECIYTKIYADYKDNGVVVFTPEPPHIEVAVYVQAITPAQKL